MKRDRDRRVQKSPHKNHRKFLIITTDEYAFGRDGHGHASKSKETL
jgi:hypothetical protein